MLNVIVLLALAALMKKTGNALTMAGLYTVFEIIISLSSGVAFASLIGGAILLFIVSFAYFYLLSRLEMSGWYWAASIVGAILVNFF